MSWAPTAARATPKLVLLHDLRLAWRVACAAHEEAWTAWLAGHGNYVHVIAALNREEAAARALARQHSAVAVAVA